MSHDPTGERHRLTEVFRRDRGRLTRFVEARLFRDGNAEAEDIVSDVVLRLFERADLLAQVEDVTAYLYGALARAVTDAFRRRRASAVVAAPGPLAGAAEAIDAADPAPDPEAALMRTEQRERIQAALRRLTPAERAVWTAVEIDGSSFREVASQRNEPLGTLLSRKSRANRKLRTLLADDRAP
ncbi:MAG: sigma-70 family RNA polymerase sigma factor [Azospirillaceae bacterium]|nr:sigma-70 family RNA polymerase sigma factor [Azospirillaceae bacterium]